MIVSFTFSKISVQRAVGAPQGKINIHHDLHLLDVKEQTLRLQDKKKGVSFTFDFIVTYDPKVGQLLINGQVLYYGTDKQINEILDSWKASKKVPPDVSLEVVNIILARCNVKALELAEDVNLPPHIPLPKLEVDTQKYSQYIG